MTSPTIKPKKKFKHPKKSLEDRKKDKESRQKRRARIIVRNISYKSTEAKLREHFTKFGTILDVNVLKRPDGKLVGCAFIQFERVNQAAKAILTCTGKDLLGRTVHIDWAVNKDKFDKHTRKTQTNPFGSFKEETKKEENSDDDDDKPEIDDETIKEEEDEEKLEQDSKDDEDDKKNVNMKLEDGEQKTRRISNDLTENCTVFIKNVPFDASSNDFKKCCLQFGAIYYALINTDPVSGHSRGTGFVKYRVSTIFMGVYLNVVINLTGNLQTKDSADMCLQAGTAFKLFNQVLDPIVAVSRQDIKKKFELAKNKEPADSRNLFLIKEGVIMAGSKSAESVSQSDMAKRLRLEQIKVQMLKDLNRYVARERLTIHNIPPAYDSMRLRKSVESHTKLKVCSIFQVNR